MIYPREIEKGERPMGLSPLMRAKIKLTGHDIKKYLRPAKHTVISAYQIAHINF
jgi:sugar/nucleoside kinase (ribokinase family)